MDPIIKVEGKTLTRLLDALLIDPTDIRTLRFAIGGDCVKVKINGGTWSPPMGEVEK